MSLRFKSAVTFFFLFFLYGFSIGNGQQGISYNVLGLCVVGELTHKSSIVVIMLNKSTNDK